LENSCTRNACGEVTRFRTFRENVIVWALAGRAAAICCTVADVSRLVIAKRVTGKTLKVVLSEVPKQFDPLEGDAIPSGDRLSNIALQVIPGARETLAGVDSAVLGLVGAGDFSEVERALPICITRIGIQGGNHWWAGFCPIFHLTEERGIQVNVVHHPPLPNVITITGGLILRILRSGVRGRIRVIIATGAARIIATGEEIA
jgi:hypothetical protein